MRNLLIPLILSLGVTACAGSSDNGDASQENLTGSLADARACAIRAAYEKADLNAFPVLGASDVPSSVPTASAVALSKLDVAQVGVVYVVEDMRGTSFFAGSGSLLARVENTRWSSPSGVLTCASDPPPPPPPPPPPSGPVSCDTTTVCTTGASAFDLGVVSGDTGADTIRATGYGSKWIKVIVNEDSLATADLRLKATLTSPPGANFDLFVHASSCGAPTSKSEKPAGEVDSAGVVVTDTFGATDDQFVLLEIRHIGADLCDANAKWSLEVEGNK